MGNIQYIKDLLLALKGELIRFRVWVAIIFAAVLAVVVVMAINWPKYYVSSSVIVKDSSNVIEPLLKGAAAVADGDKNRNIEEVLRSRRLLEKVYAKLDPNYESLAPRELEHAIYRIYGGMVVQPVKGSRGATRLSFGAGTSEEAYETLSALVAVFIADSAESKKAESNSAHSFISEQVEKYKVRLEKADQKLKEFKSRSIDATEEDVKRRIADLKAEIQDLDIAINESIQKIQTTKGQLKQESRYLSVRTELSELTQRKKILSEQLVQLRLVYQDSYPDIVTINKRIKEIDTQVINLMRGKSLSASTSDLPLFEELRKQLSIAEVELTTQKRRLVSLKRLLKEEYGRADQVAEKQAELADLLRDYDVTRKHYEQMLSRKENSNLTLALNDDGRGESYRVVEPPHFPLEPAGIPAWMIYLLAPLVALAAPIGLAGAYVLLDPRMRSYYVVQQRLPEGVDMLGRVPHRGTPLGKRLLKKDMVLLALFGVLLISVYIYVFLQFEEVFLD